MTNFKSIIKSKVMQIDRNSHRPQTIPWRMETTDEELDRKDPNCVETDANKRRMSLEQRLQASLVLNN